MSDERRKLEVPITKGMIDDIERGQIVGWIVDGIEVRLVPIGFADAAHAGECPGDRPAEARAP